MKSPTIHDPRVVAPGVSPDAQPMPTHPGSPDRIGWPRPDQVSNARRRETDAAAWSPEGPVGEWKRRSLDRFAYFRR